MRTGQRTKLLSGTLAQDQRDTCAFCGKQTNSTTYAVQAESGLLLRHETTSAERAKDVVNVLLHTIANFIAGASRIDSVFTVDRRDIFVPKTLHTARICDLCAVEHLAEIDHQRPRNMRSFLLLIGASVGGLTGVTVLTYTLLGQLFKAVEFARWFMVAIAIIGACKVLLHAGENFFRARGQREAVLVEQAIKPLCDALLREYDDVVQDQPDAKQLLETFYARKVSWEVSKTLEASPPDTIAH